MQSSEVVKYKYNTYRLKQFCKSQPNQVMLYSSSQAGFIPVLVYHYACVCVGVRVRVCLEIRPEDR